MTTNEPSIDDVIPAARERVIAASDGRWVILPPQWTPVRLSGIETEEVTLVPADAYVQAQRLADDRGRTLALVNARLVQLGLHDSRIRALLDAAGYDISQAKSVTSLIRDFSRDKEVSL